MTKSKQSLRYCQPEVTISSNQAIRGDRNGGSAPLFRQKKTIDFIVQKAVHSRGPHGSGQLRIMSEGSHDISACQIWGHYCHAFSIKYGNHTFEMFHWVKMPPKLVKSTDRDQNLIRWSGYSSIWYFRPFLHAFSRKCPKTLDLTRFIRLFWPVWPWNLPYDLENLGAKSSRCF